MDGKLGYGAHLAGRASLPTATMARMLQGGDPSQICDANPDLACCNIIADAFNDCNGVLPGTGGDDGDDGNRRVLQTQPSEGEDDDDFDFDTVCPSTCARKLREAQDEITPEQASQGVCPIVALYAVSIDL